MIFSNKSTKKVVNLGDKVVQKTSLAPVVRSNKTPNLGTGRMNSTDNVIQITLDNSAGTSVKSYMLGDANGSIAARTGKTVSNPTSISTGDTPAIFKASLATRPLLFTQMNMVTSSSALQFSQPITPYEITQQGDVTQRKRVLVGAAASSSDQDKLVRTVNQTIQLDDLNGIIFDVRAGEVLDLYFTVAEQIVR